MKKYAVLSLDVEDWYHLDYFASTNTDKTYSMLDGVNNFLEIVDSHGIPSTLFSLSDIIPKVKNELVSALKNNHEIASHGVSHQRPLTLSSEEFTHDLRESKDQIEQMIGSEIYGYRAPCFSINNTLIKNLVEVGFKYDSSAINFSSHPLYGGLNLSSFEKKLDNVYQDKFLTEFELPTYKMFNRNIPISGGGYLRIFPWIFMKNLLQNHLQNNNTYFLYIHPFELSKMSVPNVENINLLRKIRFKYGQENTSSKFQKLIYLLKENNYEFVTFKSLMEITN
jgi:polysaccharide deacetylase family protein (PEP-CTERM system associated)